MAELIALTKLDAARRQLKVAVHMLFDGGDPIAIHTLVGAASGIVSDLTEKAFPEKSWDRYAQEANQISASSYFFEIRKPQNFLKHANSDDAVTFDFNASDTDHLMFWTVMNLCNFGFLNIEEAVLQLWYLACYAPKLELDIEPYERARVLFGDLRGAPRQDRIKAGRNVLDDQLKLSC